MKRTHFSIFNFQLLIFSARAVAVLLGITPRNVRKIAES